MRVGEATPRHQVFTDWTNNYPVLPVGGALLGAGEIAANIAERHYGFKNQIQVIVQKPNR